MHAFHIILPPSYTDDIKRVDRANMTDDRIKTEIDHFYLARQSYLFLQEARLHLSGVQTKASTQIRKKIRKKLVCRADGQFAL